MSLANNISFSNFCNLCSKLKTSAKDKKLNILKKYINNWKEKGAELKQKEPQLDDSFFPVLRLLLPHLDRERGAYGVKEYTLTRIYIRILSLPKDGTDARKLLEYRAPNISRYDSFDFAEVAYWVLQNRCAEGRKLSVEDVNRYLDRISEYNALNEPRKVDSQLISLLTVTSAEEQKWLIRILLRDIKLGLGQTAIFNIYHPDAKDLYEATNNLKKVCELLKDVRIRLNEIQIELFAPFKPMLSEECSVQKVDSHLNRSPYFYVETKLDGERFQVHMNEGNYKYFSRNGFDYTENFGATIHEGSLTPRLANRFQQNVKSFILDGEMMSWNSKIGKFSSKAKNLDVKNLKEFDDHQPCFCVFDILLHNDEVLTNKPLKVRLDLLQTVVQPLDGTIVFVQRKQVSTKEEVIECLNEAIDNRDEGVVMKEFMCSYKPNIRKNGGWYKIKPEYTSGLTDTLDLLIVGGYFGSGRHKGSISHFLLGVAVRPHDSNGPLFYTVARVGSGYSANELTELLSKLKPHWKEREVRKMPSVIEWTKEKPDVWVEPKNSFILEVKAAEIIPSDSFKSGYTLRFPRVERIRYDKSWEDCLTFDEFLEKRIIAAGKLATSHVTETEVEVVPKKKSRRSKLCIQNEATCTSDIVPISDLLLNKEVCVFTGFQNIDRFEVEKKIIEYGGTIVKNPGKHTFCILAENDSTARIKNIIKCGSHDIIYTSWFFSQLRNENRSFPKLKPNNFLSMTDHTKSVFRKSYDEYGDHYTMPVTNKTIKLLLSKIGSSTGYLNITEDDKFNMDVDLYGGSSPYGVFRNCVAYFDQFTGLSDPSSSVLSDLDSYKIDFRFRGGVSVDVISDDVTHVIVFSKDLSRLKQINSINRNRQTKFNVVSEQWIKTSITNRVVSNDAGL